MILALLGRELRELCLRSEVPSCGRGFSFGETEKRDSNHVRTCRRHVREPVRTPVNTFIFRTAWFLFQVRRPLRKMQANPFFSATSSQAAYRLRRLFMLRIKSHLALISLLLLSKSNPLRWASIRLRCEGLLSVMNTQIQRRKSSFSIYGIFNSAFYIEYFPLCPEILH